MTRPFLLRNRWLLGHVIIAVLVVGFYLLSQWQMDRLHDRKESNRETHAAQDADSLAGFPPSDTPNYRTVRITGTWDASGTQLVRYPIRQGIQGYELVTPLVTSSGERIAVNRGWIPLEQGKPLATKDSAPAGEVTIEGWYHRAKPGDNKRGVNDASTPTITKITDAWLQARPGQQTSYAALTPIPLDPPDLSNGPHWSYALQWISFALIAIGGWTTLLYRVWRDENAVILEPSDAVADHPGSSSA